MSLPRGYKRLEYIQSSGTQYINAGFKPNQNTRVLCEFLTTASSTSLFGSQEAWGSKSYSFGGNTASFGANATTSLSLNNGAKHIVDFKKNSILVDGSVLLNWSGTFQLNYNMYVLANNEKNTTVYYSSAKLYSCKIYDNGTLVRDFIPCQTTSGEIGLWDDVNSVFYGNAGTGTFTAGPEIIPDPPAAPTGLQTVLAVVLQWAASANADRYDVYRDGAKLGSTEGTQYVDTTPEANQTYVYTVKAVNGGGESAGTSITVYTKSGYFEYKPMIEIANFP